MNGHDPLSALLDLVETDRVERLRAIEEGSRQSARALLAEARRAARERVQAALAVERRRLRERLASMDARLATGTRLAAQRRLRAQLDEAWRALPAALEARWRDAATRSPWVGHVRRAAVRVLGPGPWRVGHAAGWPAAEREAFALALQASGIAPAAFEESAAIGAGLVVRAGANVVDGSAAGLTADREDTDARLADALGLGGAGP